MASSSGVAVTVRPWAAAFAAQVRANSKESLAPLGYYQAGSLERAALSMACLSDEMVLAFVQGALTEGPFREVEAHLGDCPDCCALVADAVRLRSPDSTDPPGSLDQPA